MVGVPLLLQTLVEPAVRLKGVPRLPLHQGTLVELDEDPLASIFNPREPGLRVGDTGLKAGIEGFNLAEVPDVRNRVNPCEAPQGADFSHPLQCGHTSDPGLQV